MTKRICQSISFYKFHQRLEYKYISKNLTYRVIDERYTLKACSKCGKINKNLGSSEIFNCPNCKQIMDRDINGARGIYIKQFME
jgi:putative transposase